MYLIYSRAPFPADFLWYWETKASIDRQERLEREAKEKEEKALQKKQEENQKSRAFCYI